MTREFSLRFCLFVSFNFFDDDDDNDDDDE